MRIQRLLDNLKYSELANLKLGEIDTDPEKRIRVFNYIDRALAAINVEFDINQVEIIINLEPTRCKYFIQDAKLVKLIAAYYSDGTELLLNNENIVSSVFTPSLNTIEYRGTNLSSATESDYLSLIYLKGFDDITLSDNLVDVSEGLLECVTNYVGYIAYSSVDMSGDSPAKYYKQRYDESVIRAKLNGFSVDDNIDYNRLTNRGFV